MPGIFRPEIASSVANTSTTILNHHMNTLSVELIRYLLQQQ